MPSISVPPPEEIDSFELHAVSIPTVPAQARAILDAFRILATWSLRAATTEAEDST